MPDTTELIGWLPYQLKNVNNEYICRWLHCGDKEFIEPFFDETIGKCKQFSCNSSRFLPVSNLSILPEWGLTLNTIQPTAFIFHISRCGSTLVSQMLGLNDSHIVLSEVPFFDQILKMIDSNELAFNPDPALLLKTAIQFYGQNRNGRKNQLFIKMDSWHIYFMPLLRKLYPKTPFVLLYRKPDEVIRSQQQKRGIHAVPGLIADHILGINHAINAAFDLDMHMALVLESYFKSFIDISQQDKNILLVNYNQGIELIMAEIYNFTGLKISDEESKAIKERKRFDAKAPDQKFIKDLSGNSVPDYQKNVFKLYECLDKQRHALSLLK